MAEKLKEFVAGTVNENSLSNFKYLDVITTDATTQCVVKDIYVDFNNSNVSSGVILNNGVPISELSNLSGSEIVEVNSSLKFEINPVPSFGLVGGKKAIYPTSTTAMTTATNIEIGVPIGNTYNIKQASLDAIVLDTTVISVEGATSMSSPSWMYKGENHAYYFYYDGNSITYLKAQTLDGSGNMSTGWDNINTTGYAYACVDIENEKAYTIRSRVLYESNMAMRTDDTTTIIMGNNVESSNSHLAYCNGFAFFHASSSYSNIIEVADIAKNTTKTVSVDTTNFLIGGSGGLAVTYNPSEDKYYICSSSAGLATVHTISGNPVADSAVATYIGDGTLLPLAIKSDNHYRYGDRFGNMYYKSSVNSALVKAHFAGDTATLVNEYTDVLPLSGAGAIVIPDVNSTDYSSQLVATDLDISLVTKVSGVEITDVGV